MARVKKTSISKYVTIGNALGESESTICNYITGVSSNSTSLKSEKIRKASEFYDKELAAFKINLEKGIKEEVEKIE